MAKIIELSADETIDISELVKKTEEDQRKEESEDDK